MSDSPYKKLLIGGLAALTLSLGIAAPANASGMHYATTTVTWGGSPCIEVYEDTGYHTFCDYGSWDIHDRVWSGDRFGADPIMGGADWVSCEVYLDTVLVYSDYAERGDGTDVNCLRVVN